MSVAKFTATVLISVIVAGSGIGCGGGDSTSAEATGSDAVAAPDPNAEALRKMVEVRGALRDEIENLATAKGAKDVQRTTGELTNLNKQVKVLKLETSDGPSARFARAALASLREAISGALALTEILETTLAEAEVAREPSDEAQAQVLALSSDVENLFARLATVKRSVALFDKSLAGADPEAAKMGFDVDGVVKRLSENLGELKARLDDEAEALVPVDVVLDCVSEYSTVSAFSVRNMSCEDAQALLDEAIGSLSGSGFMAGAFSCSILGDYGGAEGNEEVILGASDVHCESGDQAFRFSFAD